VAERERNMVIAALQAVVNALLALPCMHCTLCYNSLPATTYRKSQPLQSSSIFAATRWCPVPCLVVLAHYRTEALLPGRTL
jgi:hypothetical protein